MDRQFIILNNALRDMSGHYYETAVSVAEAAREAGWRPVVATHVECRTDLFPDWLEAHPIFCTDHWMAKPAAAPPDLGGARLEPYSVPCVPIKAVRHGQATVREFLASRITSLSTTAPTAPPETDRRLRQALDRGRWFFRKALWGSHRAAYYFLPPFLYDGGRLLVRTAARQCVPPAFRPDHQPRIRARMRQIAERLRITNASDHFDFVSHGPAVAAGLQQPAERPCLEKALRELAPLNLAHEIEHALIFKRDLERLLAISGAGPDDHVLLSTAHAREVLAVGLVAQRLGDARCPTFHLEFRHPLFEVEPEEDELEHSPVVRLHRGFFSFHERQGTSNRIRFYTDTEELSRDFEFVSGWKFGVLPIPFRAGLIVPSPRTDKPLCLAFLGDVRDEKGFHWLPGLVDHLMRDYVRPGRVRLALQATVGTPHYNPQSALAMQRLRKHLPRHVELVGADGPLTSREYYRLVSAADVVLLPYDRNRYRAASSGTLAEAIAAGKPTVVPAQSWMSRQQPPGTGETFVDFQSFVASVRRLVDRYEEYHRQAELHRSAWSARHSPRALVEALTGRALVEAAPARVALVAAEAA